MSARDDASLHNDSGDLEVVALRVNGSAYTLTVRSDERLLDVLRDRLELYSVRDGCSVGMCGACTVLIDGRAVSSCLTLAALCDESQVVTAEGLLSGERLDPVAQTFLDHRAFQCSYCTPGFILALKGLLLSEPDPTPAQVASWLSGHLCRCGSYSRILAAALEVTASRPSPGESAAEAEPS